MLGQHSHGRASEKITTVAVADTTGERRMKHRRGGLSSGQTILLVGLVLAGVGVGWFIANGGQTPTTTPAQIFTVPSQPSQPSNTQSDIDKLTQATACSGDQNPDITIATVNKERLGIATDYNSAKVNFVNLDDSSNRFTLNTNAGATISSVSETSKGKCNARYAVVIESNSSNVNGDYLLTYSETGQPFVNVPGGIQALAISVSNFSNLQARVYDLDLNGFIYLTGTDDPSSAADVNTAFQALAAVGTTVFNTTTINGTGKSIAADENNKFWYRLDVQTVSPYGRFGKQSYMAVDYADDDNANDWSEPYVKVGATASSRADSLQNVKATLDADDQIALNAYEAVYDLGQAIGGPGITSVYVKMMTGAGTNPDYDPTFRFVASGIDESVKSPGTYLGISKARFFGDDSSRTQIATSTVNAMSISVV